MLTLSFSFDGLAPAGMSEAAAPYQLDGPLHLHQGRELLFQEPSVPLLELAVFFSHWMRLDTAAKARTHAFSPSDFDDKDVPLLQLAPAHGTRYVLSWSDGLVTRKWPAEQADWDETFARFLAALRQSLQETYQLNLDHILQRFVPPAHNV
jgi:hypothetical protein